MPLLVSGKNEALRIALPILLIAGMAVAVGIRLTMLHLDLVANKPKAPGYVFHRVTQGIRGSIYSSTGVPLAKTMTVWDYYVDAKAASQNPFNPKKPVDPAKRMDNIRRVSETLGISLAKVMDAFARVGNRHVYLTRSDDNEAHAVLFPTDPKLRKKRIYGLIAEEKQVRVYPQGRCASQVLGYVSKDPTNSVGTAGLELKYERYLKGTPGEIHGTKDANGNEERILRDLDVTARPGCDIHLTIDNNIQYEVEKILAEGIASNRAEKGWAIVLSVKTGAILAMASYPDYEPENYNRFNSNKACYRNCTIDELYEPGSVMKTITACAVLNEGMVKPETVISTARNDDRYYRLPSDSHRMEPFLTVTEALVHSSNVVFGKLGVDLGPTRLCRYMTDFGLGRKVGIELPGEIRGIIPNPAKWDKVKWSRAPIGQGIAVTALQLAAAYACIGNDGELLKPYLVERVVQADGDVVYQHERQAVKQVIDPEVARKVRSMMLGVAKKGGTARRAAIPGYTVAGKTGTAQMREGKGYSSTNYNASFIGIVPATRPEIVVLVTYQKPFYCRSFKVHEETGIPLYNHQGGVCAAPVFRRIASMALRYLAVEPDIPEEIPDEIE
ncbi:MAG: peptidoglycan D,D-transpeptidase FtsI family protein [Kiritimatiellia bacterium]